MSKPKPPPKRNPEARALACRSLRPRRIETRKRWSKADRKAMKSQLKKGWTGDQAAAEMIPAFA